jgi:2-polyprenyl-3-methyl-5-hydroxy-6-metoxy-1,4-benzoquinol methylase
MVHHELCPLCSSEMISAHFNCTDYFISKEIFAIYRCSACGFLFTQDYPDEDEIYRYYESDDYISHSDTSAGIINKLYHLVRRLMLRRKRRIIESLTGLKNGNLLDVGSGTGHFASVMKKSGWVVKGIEISEKARNFAASAFGLEIIAPDQISGLEAESFDCVTMWHVLEHFHNPEKNISYIVKLLKPGGTCLIALPNSGSCDAKFYRHFWAAFDVPRHLWHFDPVTFHHFTGRTGLKFEGQFVLPFDVFYISSLSERYKGSQFPFVKGIIRASWFSYLSVFDRNRSSSVIYILRKPVY